LFFILYKFNGKDFFSVDAYNSNLIKDTSKSQLDIQTEKIKDVLNKYYTSKDYEIEKIDKTKYRQLSFFEKFVFEQRFKEFFINELQGVLSKEFPDIILTSPHELKNIYWKDTLQNREYMFDITISSSNYGFTRIFSCYVILFNINNFTLDTGEYKQDIKLQRSDIDIKYITETKEDKEELLPPRPLFNYFEIRNILHLSNGSDEQDMKITKELEEKFQASLIKKSESLETYSSGKCFDKDDTVLFSDKNTDENKAKCQNEDQFNRWDTVPFNSFDCPFYKKNLNYPNEFGKLINNKCEMPSNVKRQGYRFYSQEVDLQPLCYNCKTDTIGQGTLGKCCDKQLNRDEYPELLTPDYAFPGDELLREKYSNLFLEKKLKTK
jgi:hypothetical protein